MNPTLCHSVCRDLELVVKHLGTLPSKSDRQTSGHTEHLTWYCSESPGKNYTERALARSGILRSEEAAVASMVGTEAASILELQIRLCMNWPIASLF